MAWAAAGLVALLVLAVVVVGGGGSTNEAKGAAPSTHFSDPGAEEWLPESPATDSSGPESNDLGSEPSLLDQAFDEEDSTLAEEGDSNGLGPSAGGTDSFEGWDVPAAEDGDFGLKVPGSWSVEESGATDALHYISDDGLDSAVIAVTPTGPALGERLGEFADFMQTGMINRGATVSDIEPAEVGGRSALKLSFSLPGDPRDGIVWMLDGGPTLYSIVAELPGDPALRSERNDEVEAAVQSFDVSDG